MSFFKLLSDNPSDYESDDSAPDDCQDDTQMFSKEGHLEMLLDTGELFSVPLDWLISAARHYNFHRETDHSGGSIH